MSTEANNNNNNETKPPRTATTNAANVEATGKHVEAQHYIEVALNEINEGNYDQAVALLEQAKMLWPESQAAEMQALVHKLHANVPKERRRQQQQPHHHHHEPHPNTTNDYADTDFNASTSYEYNNNFHNNIHMNNTSNMHRRKRSTTPAAAPQPPPPATGEGSCTGTASADDYTPQQLELVKKIKKCKNFYQVLNVAHDATDADIKKAYKKLALQLHPDKNSAPGAVEAFKLVGSAVEVLCNEHKRKEYDDAGANTLTANGGLAKGYSHYNQRNHNHHHHPQYYHDTQASFEAAFGGDDITAEELFQMFFGHFPAQGQRQRRTYQFANQRQPQENFQQPSLVFTLILVLILISLISSIFTSDPVYNLSQSNKYPVRRETQHLTVPYFVKENFERDFRGSLGRLENTIEEDYVYTMKQNCYRERSYREAMMARARSFGSRVQFAQAQGLKMPSCDNLSKIGIQRYSLY